MDNNSTIDNDLLLNIRQQLSELNDKLSRRPQYTVNEVTRSRKSYLFTFELNGGASAEEYRKYCSFLDNITAELGRFGIHIGNNGYAYIMDDVNIIIERASYEIRLKSDLYPMIARKYNLKNTDAVEHSIRNALNKAYAEYQKNPDCNCMGEFSRKPTNKQFLIYVTNNVLKSMYETLMQNAC